METFEREIRFQLQTQNAESKAWRKNASDSLQDLDKILQEIQALLQAKGLKD